MILMGLLALPFWPGGWLPRAVLYTRAREEASTSPLCMLVKCREGGEPMPTWGVPPGVLWRLLVIVTGWPRRGPKWGLDSDRQLGLGWPLRCGNRGVCVGRRRGEGLAL